MKYSTYLSYKFVEYVPKKIDEKTLYVSTTFSTVVHKCCCGCGNEVVTPLSPTDWELNFDGESISLHPSIGNWNLPCKSHYWIKRNRVLWAREWPKEKINTKKSHNQLTNKIDLSGIQKLSQKRKSWYKFIRYFIS